MDGKHILLRDSVVGGLLFFLGFAVADANAATVNAASCSQANGQTAITAAGIGDTVYVPAGTCTWAGGVSWNNKNISLLGAGKDATIINCQSCLTITSSSTTSTFSQWRLANMTFQGAAPSGTMMTIWDNNGSWHYRWRIDHMKFNYPGAGAGYGVFIGGPTYGLL